MQKQKPGWFRTSPANTQGKKYQQLLIISFTTIFFQEFFNPTGSINQFLLTGEKRMTGRTYLNSDLFFNGIERNLISTGTGSINLMTFRVDAFSHVLILLIRFKSIRILLFINR